MTITADQFLLKTSPEPMSGCWLWTGKTDRNGYGSVLWKGRNIGAHRMAWMYYRDEALRDDLDVLHRCDLPACVNPAHLWLGTARDNLRDMMRKGRKEVLVGSRNGKSKLTESVVAEMRSLASTVRIRREAIAALFGLEKTWASKIIARRWWRHVP